jgi:hypothetical protein
MFRKLNLCPFSGDGWNIHTLLGTFVKASLNWV